MAISFGTGKSLNGDHFYSRVVALFNLQMGARLLEMGG